MDEVLKEMLRGLADILMTGSRSGSVVNTSDDTDYGEYCRNNATKVVAFLNHVMVGQKANVRTVELLPRPTSSCVDLLLKVYTSGLPADDLYYPLTCTYKDRIFSIDVRQI